MKNINNNHGFTLVELLAVIVVLAIVMLVAVQSVLPQMEKARRQTLALDAQTAIESANTYFMNKSLSNPNDGFPMVEGGTTCVSIDTLISQGYFTTKGQYEGSVQVKKSGSTFLFTVWLKKDALAVIAAGNDGSTNTQIVAGETGDQYNDVFPASAWTKSTETTPGMDKCVGNKPS